MGGGGGYPVGVVGDTCFVWRHLWEKRGKHISESAGESNHLFAALYEGTQF